MGRPRTPTLFALGFRRWLFAELLRTTRREGSSASRRAHRAERRTEVLTVACGARHIFDLSPRNPRCCLGLSRETNGAGSSSTSRRSGAKRGACLDHRKRHGTPLGALSRYDRTRALLRSRSSGSNTLPTTSIQIWGFAQPSPEGVQQGMSRRYANKVTADLLGHLVPEGFQEVHRTEQGQAESCCHLPLLLDDDHRLPSRDRRHGAA